MLNSREPIQFNDRPSGVSASEPLSLFVLKSLLYPNVPVVTGAGDVTSTLVGINGYQAGLACVYLGTGIWMAETVISLATVFPPAFCFASSITREQG